MQVDNFDVPDLRQRLLEAALFPPSIVKARVACGVSDAHSMVISVLLCLDQILDVVGKFVLSSDV